MLGDLINGVTSFFKEKENERENMKMKKMQDLLNTESLTCKKCNSTSYPVWGTKNKYRCLKCNNRFTNSNHDLISKSLDKFNISPRQYSEYEEEKIEDIYNNCIEKIIKK